mmetsp:Transcript_10554/g.25223  ORF Transcript_10554/g.25223 Transcript_10554/m.25223 type:complete len:298 (-) Transcript_10554:26-919(-)
MGMAQGEEARELSMLERAVHVKGLGGCLLSSLSCADVRSLAAAGVTWAQAVVGLTGQGSLLLLLPVVGYRYSAPRCLSPSQLYNLATGRNAVINSRGEPCRWRWTLSRAGAPGCASRCTMVEDGALEGLGAKLLPLTWSALLREPRWLRLAPALPRGRGLAAMTYPERWVRGCRLAACLCLRGKVDRGPDLWELRAQSLCATVSGELVLWCHQFFRNEALGLVMHSGAAVAGGSLGALEAHCRAHRAELPRDLARFAEELGLFAGLPGAEHPLYDEWVRLDGGEGLALALDRLMAGC